jgi:hypothetical protein
VSSIARRIDSPPDRSRPSAAEVMADRSQRRLAARERLQIQKHRLHHARMAEEAMSLVAYYSARPLLAVRLGELPYRGRLA